MKIFVSAIIINLPSPAKAMLADVVPMKNLPSRVPVFDHTWETGWMRSRYDPGTEV